jgi:hypothetical protein
MKQWLIIAAAVLCCGLAAAADEAAVSDNPQADYYVAASDMAKLYRALADEMADYTAQRRKVFVVLGGEVDTPTGPAAQVSLLEETEYGLKTLKIFALDEAGCVYEAIWREQEQD